MFFSKSVKKSVKRAVRVLRAKRASGRVRQEKKNVSPQVSLSVFSLVPDLLFDCLHVLEYAKIRTVLQSIASALSSFLFTQIIFAPLFSVHLSVHQIVFLHSYLFSSVMACRLLEWFPEKPWWYSLSCFWLISTFATLLVVFVPTPVNKPATFNGHNLIPRVLSYPSLRSEKAERGRQEKEPGNEVVLVVFSTYMENPFYNQHSHSYFHIQINLVRTLARS